MSKAPITRFIEPRKLADRQVVLEGSVQLSDMKRLASALVDDQGAISARFEFDRDEQGTIVFQSLLNADVNMVCQRCLETVELPVQSECTYAAVRAGASTQHIPSSYDVLEVGEDPLDLLALVEDELLLALPIVPLHDLEVCQPPAGSDQAEPVEETDKRSNPFSVLAQLKRDPNV